MENKINIAELLKDCPSGMELDCTLFEGLEFDGIVDNEYLPIRCRVKNPDGGYNVYNFTKYGCWIDTTYAKCVIFPKGKTTWEGFQRPFKDGEIVYIKTNAFEYIFIFKINKDDRFIEGYATLSDSSLYVDGHLICDADDVKEIRLATETERTKLFDAIKARGYYWNSDTKTLETLIKSIFKAGNKIRSKNKKDECFYILDVDKDRNKYILNIKGYCLEFKDQNNYELVLDKFDVSTLKPFDKVLVRCSSLEKWHIQFFEKYNTELGAKYPFICLCNSKYCQCIPYEGNEHLLNTANDCDNFYKIW